MTMISEVFSVLSEEFNRNPYRYFAYLREEDPVHYEESIDSYFLSKYDDIYHVLRHPDVFTTDSLAKRAEPVMRGPVLAQMRGQEHTAKRKIVVRSLTGEEIKQQQIPLIKASVMQLLDPYREMGRLDLVNEFGKTLAVWVTMDILGLDKTDHQLISHWHNGIASFITSIEQSPEDRSHSLWCSEQLGQYLLPIIEQRRTKPGLDLISTLCASEYNGTTMSDTNILSLVLNILLAATEPADKTLALLIYHLLNNPTQMKDVLEDRSLLPQAIAETLRYTPPVQLIPRQLSDNATVGGKELRSGTTVFCMIGAANRDPNVFKLPDVFDIHRSDLGSSTAFTGAARHLAFGSGVHNCVGAALAKIELETVADILLDMLPNMRLEEGFIYSESGLYTRGPISLPVQFDVVIKNQSVMK